jgi:hypothetical protein
MDGAGTRPAPFETTYREILLYQLPPVQPPLLPPTTAQLRDVVPSLAFVMVNVLVDFDVAVTT